MMTNLGISEQDLRNSLSLGRLDIDFSSKTIAHKPTDELERGLLAMIEMLRRYYSADNEEDFNLFIKKRTKNKIIVHALIRLLPEFSIDKVSDELILKIVTTANGPLDSDKLISLISKERKARLNLRQIEDKIIQEHLTMTTSEFDIAIRIYEDNERSSLDLYLKTLDFIMNS